MLYKGDRFLLRYEGDAGSLPNSGNAGGALNRQFQVAVDLLCGLPYCDYVASCDYRAPQFIGQGIAKGQSFWGYGILRENEQLYALTCGKPADGLDPVVEMSYVLCCDILLETAHLLEPGYGEESILIVFLWEDRLLDTRNQLIRIGGVNRNLGQA